MAIFPAIAFPGCTKSSMAASKAAMSRHTALTRSLFVLLLLTGTSQAQTPSPNRSATPATGEAVVTLTNGDRISGELVEESADSITIHHEVLGKLQVPRSITSDITLNEHGSQSEKSSVGLLQQNSLAASSPQLQPTSTAAGISGKLVVAKFKLSTALLLSTQKQQSYSGELDLVKNWHAAATAGNTNAHSYCSARATTTRKAPRAQISRATTTRFFSTLYLRRATTFMCRCFSIFTATTLLEFTCSRCTGQALARHSAR